MSDIFQGFFLYNFVLIKDSAIAFLTLIYWYFSFYIFFQCLTFIQSTQETWPVIWRRHVKSIQATPSWNQLLQDDVYSSSHVSHLQCKRENQWGCFCSWNECWSSFQTIHGCSSCCCSHSSGTRYGLLTNKPLHGAKYVWLWTLYGKEPDQYGNVSGIPEYC